MEGKKEVLSTQEDVSSTRGREVSPTSKQRKESPIRNLSPNRTVVPTTTEPTKVSDSNININQVVSDFEQFKCFDFQNLNKDPLVNMFNNVFTRDTHKLLGLSGIKVSRITLGSMNFGPLDPQFGERQGQLDENQAHQILDRYVELGGNCIETANFFPWFGKTSGESERIIGNWLVKRSDRERLVIISKIRLPTNPANASSIGLSRTNVINSVENILRRLQTNYIDLLQIDGWDYTVHVNEIIRVYDELLMSGKVRNFGVCDFKAWQLQNIIDKSKMLNKHRIASYQGEYSLLSRGSEMEVVDVCLNHGLGFIAYSPFKYGFLTDTYANQTNIEQPEQGTRLESTAGPHTNLSSMGEPFELAKYNPAFKNLFCALKCIAKNRNIAIQKIALRWILQQEFISTVVVGVSNISELEDSMRVLTEFCLTEDEMHQLDVSSLPYLPYPYLSTTTEFGRKLFMHTPGPVVYSHMSYLTQAITLNDRMFDYGYPESFFVKNLQPLTSLHPKISSSGDIKYQQQNMWSGKSSLPPYIQQQQQNISSSSSSIPTSSLDTVNSRKVPLEQKQNVEPANIKNEQLVQQQEPLKSF